MEFSIFHPSRLHLPKPSITANTLFYSISLKEKILSKDFSLPLALLRKKFSKAELINTAGINISIFLVLIFLEMI